MHRSIPAFGSLLGDVKAPGRHSWNVNWGHEDATRKRELDQRRHTPSSALASGEQQFHIGTTEAARGGGRSGQGDPHSRLVVPGVSPDGPSKMSQVQ